MLTVRAAGAVPGLSTAGVAAGLPPLAAEASLWGAVVALVAPAVIAVGIGCGYRLARLVKNLSAVSRAARRTVHDASGRGRDRRYASLRALVGLRSDPPLLSTKSSRLA